jgi:2-polyprenyl-3-methyl-5-hydroxy-6-metoxy-1,4-benzoquinol methylase
MSEIEKIGGVTLNYRYYGEVDEYNDGDEVEDYILKVVKEKRDIFDVLSEDNRWPVLCHLSPQRGNITEPMSIGPEDDVLEIGAGLGAITSSLSKLAGHVDCIELSRRRALINAYRNMEHDNIEIYVGNFEEIKSDKKYDVVAMIGVLEYALHYIKGERPFDTFMKKVHDFLKPGGRAYVAIENRLGMKYFSGAPEDHIGIPFCGIEGYLNVGDKARTFSRSELDALILRAGFSSTYFYYPFPDYKLPTVIYSDDYLPEPGDSLPPSPAYDLPRVSVFNERNAISSLFGSNEYRFFANSFLVEAVK